jgi:hypothetical protein
MAFARQTSPHGTLLALSTMKDECPHVVEWVAHHLALGFTQVIVYTNDCTDGTDTMLKRMEALGIGVEHRENLVPEGMKPQPSMLKYASDDAQVRASDWVLILDADEFLAINHPSGTMDGLVADLAAIGAEAIVFTWRIFGSNGVQHWSRAPVTDQFTRAAPESWFMGWGTKTLFRYDPKYLRLGIHRPVIKAQHKETDYVTQTLWVNGSGKPLEDWFKLRGWRSIRRTVGFDWGQINHYAIKSMDAYALRKLRGNVNLKADKYNTDYWSLQDRNEVEDLRIARHRERRDQIMAWFLEDPEIRALHEAAHARVEARLAEHRQTTAYTDLVQALNAASNKPINQVVAKPPKARDKEAVKAAQGKLDQIRRTPDGSPPPPPRWASPFASPYVGGAADMTGDLSVDVAENQGLKVPLDPRIFTAATIEVLQSGKFERRHARNIAGLLADASRLLDLDCGVGFTALRAKASLPDLEVTLHEERPTLRAFSQRLAALNLPGTSGLHWSRATLNPDGIWSGLHTLLAQARPQVLRLSGPLLASDAFTEAALQGITRILIPFLDPSEITTARDKLSQPLHTLGFTEDTTTEALGTLCLRRE